MSPSLCPYQGTLPENLFVWALGTDFEEDPAVIFTAPSAPSALSPLTSSKERHGTWTFFFSAPVSQFTFSILFLGKVLPSDEFS